MNKPQVSHGPADYEIIIKGSLGSNWSDWFSDMTVESLGGVTIISTRAMDQSALHGLIMRIRNLGLPLIYIKRIDVELNRESQEVEK